MADSSNQCAPQCPPQLAEYNRAARGIRWWKVRKLYDLWPILHMGWWICPPEVYSNVCIGLKNLPPPLLGGACPFLTQSLKLNLIKVIGKTRTSDDRWDPDVCDLLLGQQEKISGWDPRCMLGTKE